MDGGPDGSVVALSIAHSSRVRAYELIEVTFSGAVVRRATVPGTTAGTFWRSYVNRAFLIGTDAAGVAYVAVETETIAGSADSVDMRLFLLQPGSTAMEEVAVPVDILDIAAAGSPPPARRGRVTGFGRGEIWVRDQPTDANGQRQIAVWNVTTGERRDISGPLEMDAVWLNRSPYWFGPGAALRFRGEPREPYCVWTLHEDMTSWQCLHPGGTAAIDFGPSYGYVGGQRARRWDAIDGTATEGETNLAIDDPCGSSEMSPTGRDGLLLAGCPAGFMVASRELVILASVRFATGEGAVTYGEVQSVFAAQALDW